MAARASYGHSKLRIGWLGSAAVLRAHPLTAQPELAGKNNSNPICQHILFGWGQGLQPNAHDISSRTDDEAACLIRTNEVDVLIDLMGCGENSRPTISDYHPASLQLTWLAKSQPSGMAAIDGALVDLAAIPATDIPMFMELLVDVGRASEIAVESPQSFLWRVEQLLRDSHAKLQKRTNLTAPTNGTPDYISPPKSKGRRYTIVAPPYEHTSAGIRVLYDLQKWLIRAGYDSIVCTWFQGYPVGSFKDDIVVYPEVAPGNLLNGSRIVRFILNMPGKLGHGERTFAQNELLVAYNLELAPYADGLVLQVPSTEPFFYSENSIRDKDAFYVGKGRNLGLHPPNCVEITKNYPATRSALADFLRTVNTLYSYDDFTMLAHEAELCGCKVTLIDKMGQVGPLQNLPVPDALQFSAQLHTFIELTQSL
jgi:hypothetical protein